MGDTTLTSSPFAGVAVIAAEQPWFQAWVPFQSGYLSNGGAMAQPSTSFVVGPYGLLDPTKPQPMGSFLHLGATDADMLTPNPVAENDPQKQATFLRAYNLASQVSSFIDDYRVRGPDATPPAERLKETQLLLKKGGWRDHTDGNRITTTAGDKVEVIGGNSTLVILGRPTTDNAFSALDWSETGQIANHEIESSGTFNYDNDGAPGHVEEIRWVDNPYPGTASTWMVRSKTYQADEIDISSGELRESFIGTTVELSSGDAYRYRGRIADIPAALSGNPTFNLQRVMRDEQLDTGKEFPYIGDNTDESFIDSVTLNAQASFGAGLASNLSQNLTEYAVVDSMYTDTTVNGIVTDITTVNGSAVSTNTVNGPVTETTTMTSLVAITTVSEATTEVTTVGLNAATVTTVGLAVEDVTTVGLNSLSVEIVALAKEEIAYASVETDISISLESLDIAITGLAQEVAVYVDKIDVDMGVAKQIITLTPYVSEFETVKETLAALKTFAAETWLRLSSPLVTVEGIVMLGGDPEAEEEMEAEEAAADEAAAAPEEEAAAAPAEAAAA